MAITAQGVPQRVIPVRVDSTASVTKGDLVQIASGAVTPLAANDAAGLAVVQQTFSDDEYDGTQNTVMVMLLGETQLVEAPFVNSGGSNTLAEADFGGGPFHVEADGDVDLDSTAATAAFIPLYRGPGTDTGDATGTVIGVFTDAASYGS